MSWSGSGPSAGATATAAVTIDPPGVVVVAFEGELDATQAGFVRDSVGAACEQPAVVIDLASTSFVDSAALGAIIGGIRAVRSAGGAVAINCPDDTIRHLLRTTGVDRLVPVGRTRDATEVLLT
jgi:anti-sigma B factor antagonist